MHGRLPDRQGPRHRPQDHQRLPRGQENRGESRHLAVDAEGWLLALVVTAASVSDKAGAKLLIIRLFNKFSTLKIMWADNGYDGAPLARYAKAAAAITVEVVKRTAPHSFQVLRRRWVIERTFGWLMRYRRLARDYERRTDHAEAMIYWAQHRHHDQAPRPLRNRNAGRAALGRRTRTSRPARAGGAANMNSFIYRLLGISTGATGRRHVAGHLPIRPTRFRKAEIPGRATVCGVTGSYIRRHAGRRLRIIFCRFSGMATGSYRRTDRQLCMTTNLKVPRVTAAQDGGSSRPLSSPCCWSRARRRPAGRVAVRPVVRRPGLCRHPSPGQRQRRTAVAEPARDAGCRRHGRREPDAQSPGPQFLPGSGVRLRGPRQPRHLAAVRRPYHIRPGAHGAWTARHAERDPTRHLPRPWKAARTT